MRSDCLRVAGELKGRVVVGRIFDMLGDDLYIDLGLKFHSVCKRTRPDPYGYYRTGAMVRVRLESYEMSARFLGSRIPLSIFEADCTLLGLLHPPPLALGQEPPRSAPRQQQQRQHQPSSPTQTGHTQPAKGHPAPSQGRPITQAHAASSQLRQASIKAHTAQMEPSRTLPGAPRAHTATTRPAAPKKTT